MTLCELVAAQVLAEREALKELVELYQWNACQLCRWGPCFVHQELEDARREMLRNGLDQGATLDRLRELGHEPHQELADLLDVPF